MKTSIITSVSLLALVVSSCNSNDLRTLDERLSVKMDPALDRATQKMLRADILQLKNEQLNAADSSPFSVAFGGTDSSGVLRYLDERVSYIVPELDNPVSRLKYGGLPLPVDKASEAKSKDDDRAVLMALNIGVGMWFLNQANPTPLGFTFTVGNQDIPLASSRVGIVELGPGYTMKELSPGIEVTSVVRNSTLVHEARHSDCTGGLLPSDRLRLRDGLLQEDHQCGHTHIECPQGHSLAGLFACDDHAWGAYSIGALFDLAIYKTCSNCSELEKQQALMGASDSLSRVVVLRDMLDGKLGQPDMSSSD